jgi:hypothetical protein
MRVPCLFSDPVHTDPVNLQLHPPNLDLYAAHENLSTYMADTTLIESTYLTHRDIGVPYVNDLSRQTSRSSTL